MKTFRILLTCWAALASLLLGSILIGCCFLRIIEFNALVAGLVALLCAWIAKPPPNKGVR